jgi:hypothetical protein
LVALVQAADIPHEVPNRLAKDLHQDCIAVYYAQRDEGTLIRQFNFTPSMVDRSQI